MRDLSLETALPPGECHVRGEWLAGLLLAMGPGEVFTVSSPQLADYIVAAVEEGLIKPVYRLTESEAWTTNLMSLRSRPGGADPSKVHVAFLRL